jgi:hypothetical protein
MSRLRIAVPAALALPLALLALAWPATAPAATGFRTCTLSPGQQLPPGGTPAYDLTVQRRATPCGDAVAVMRAFHRCRTATGTTCDRRLPGGWRCTGTSDRATPTMRGSFSCRRSGAGRVRGTYWQERRACFGAAARDPALPCRDEARTAVPTGPDSDGTWNWPQGMDNANGGVALVGDSHTVHWASALWTVLQAQRWGGIRFSSPGCYVNTRVGGFSSVCAEWYGEVQQFLRTHPQVSTLFVTASGDTPVGVAPEQYATVKTEGFREAFRAVPASVEHIIVLRDTTRSTPSTLSCIDAAIAARAQRLAPLCPLPKAAALADDLAVTAARSLHDPRYSVIDLTRYLCTSRACHPVVGGVRVNQDQWGHLNSTFTRTLGPYLLREVRRLQAAW